LTGVVQETLGTIVTCMLDLSVAVEDYVQSDVFVQAVGPLLGHQLARAECTTLSNHLDNALHRLAQTFERSFELMLNQHAVGSPQYQRLETYIGR
jgi:hypothetical protein